MRIGLLIGGLPSLQPTFAGVHLAWSAHRRGHEVSFVTADDLSFLDDGSVLATTLRVRAGDYAKPADFHRALLSGDAVREDDTLSGFDVVFIRYNPLREPHGAPLSPILDFCWRLRLDGTFVVNDPEGVFRAWGRLYLANLPADVHARTLVSRSPAQIKAFLRELDGDAVLKPLAHAGREKVFHVRRGQLKNVNAIITAITRDGYVVAQEYLPEAEDGEKRLLLLGGEPIRIGGQVAIYRRLPGLADGEKQHSSLKRRLRCRRGTHLRPPAAKTSGRRPLLRQRGPGRRQDPRAQRLLPRRHPFPARDLSNGRRPRHHHRPRTPRPPPRGLQGHPRSRGGWGCVGGPSPDL
jgi:glutathione synthase